MVDPQPVDTPDDVIEKLARASWDASEGFVTGVPWPPRTGLRAERERRRVRAILAVLNGDFPYVGQQVEWNTIGDTQVPGIVSAVKGDVVRVLVEDTDGDGYVDIEKRHLRAAKHGVGYGD